MHHFLISIVGNCQLDGEGGHEGWEYGWIAYTLATVVGISRMEGPDDYHDIWDVIARASVGVGITFLFTSPYPKKH